MDFVGQSIVCPWLLFSFDFVWSLVFGNVSSFFSLLVLDNLMSRPLILLDCWPEEQSLDLFVYVFTLRWFPFNEMTWKTDVWPSFGNWWKSIIGSLQLAPNIPHLTPDRCKSTLGSEIREGKFISGLSGNFRFQPTIQFRCKDEKTSSSTAFLFLVLYKKEDLLMRPNFKV